MKLGLLSILMFLLGAVPAALVFGQEGPVVSLVTIGAGDQIYEKYAHNAIRLQDASLPAPRGDVSFNYGIFSFGGDFFYRFAVGEMRYWMGPEYTPDMMAWYRSQNRGMVEQRLALGRAGPPPA